jgi:hypothetical protein
MPVARPDHADRIGGHPRQFDESDPGIDRRGDQCRQTTGTVGDETYPLLPARAQASREEILIRGEDVDRPGDVESTPREQAVPQEQQVAQLLVGGSGGARRVQSVLVTR